MCSNGGEEGVKVGKSLLNGSDRAKKEDERVGTETWNLDLDKRGWGLGLSGGWTLEGGGGEPRGSSNCRNS